MRTAVAFFQALAEEMRNRHGLLDFGTYNLASFGRPLGPWEALGWLSKLVSLLDPFYCKRHLILGYPKGLVILNNRPHDLSQFGVYARIISDSMFRGTLNPKP